MLNKGIWATLSSISTGVAGWFNFITDENLKRFSMFISVIAGIMAIIYYHYVIKEKREARKEKKAEKQKS